MRVTRQQANENRNRVLHLAARRFRERGFGGLAVADLMEEAGLTHGGFYKQFASKEDLAAEACALAIADNLAAYQNLAKQNPKRVLPAMISALISEPHRDSPGDGCILASLGADISRSGPPVRREVTTGVRKILSCLAGLIPGRTKKRARQQAISTYATIVGALVIARAVEDSELSREILNAARNTVIENTKPTE